MKKIFRDSCIYNLKNKIEDNIFVINGDTLIDVDINSLDNFQKK